jgi:hypothetical protein
MNTTAVGDPFSTEAWNVAAYAYDCVIAFAIAFSQSTDFNNGFEVVARFREARFNGATGQVQFDAKGDRDPTTINCTLLRTVPILPGWCAEKHGTAIGYVRLACIGRRALQLGARGRHH